MNNNFLRITHCADVQVKNRNIPLYISTEKTLKSIENYIQSSQVPIHIISGDLFEYATPNESERKLIYNHIARLIQIPTLKEIVIIAGNHDLLKENKKEQENKDNTNNAISIFADLVKFFDTDKLRYFSETGVYQSNVYSKIYYHVYSLEDKETWGTNMFKQVDGIKLCLYHAMIKEYVDYDKLPIPNHVYSKLDSMDMFPSNSLILAGDIHKTLIFEDKTNLKKFIYPGSTMQHTFGEGVYFNDDKINNGASDKCMMQYFIPLDNCETIYDIKISKVELKNQVSYNTILLDNKKSIPLIKEYLNNINIKEGLNQTFIKIISSNKFISEEKNLFDILKAKYNNAYIQFDYQKFDNTTVTSDNKIIQDIIDKKSEELKNSNSTLNTNGILSTNNIDDLLLNQEQLTTLFDSVLDKIIVSLSNEFDKETNEKDVHSDIINLFKQQLSLVTENSNNSRYNIEFKNIKCNGFMLLGENNINLDYYNIVRILGTNGVGKTTLYRMIRWCITGQIYEGMSNNQVVKNNLLVFNKKQPNNNVVAVNLELLINNQRVNVIRSVKRIWKQNVTEEQKLEQNWFDYVSNIERTFELHIFDKESTEPVKKLSGDNAEKLLIKWFGNTLNTILFLNQSKITSILNTASDKLNELILNYIGVDYLNKLESNLDCVKQDLFNIVAKPKRDLESIRESIIDSKILVEKYEKLMVENEDKQSYTNSIINELKAGLELVVNNLLKSQNPDIAISNLTEDLINKTKEKKILEEETNQVFEKPLFTLIKPTLDSERINQFDNEIDKNLKLIDELTQEINNLKSKDLKNIENKIDEFIENKKNQLNNKLVETQNKFNQINTDIKNTYEIIIKEYFIDEEKHYINSVKELRDSKSKLEEQNNQITNKIKEFEEQIKSGICPTCNRPFEDDFETHKVELTKKIEIIKNKFTSNEKQIKETDDVISKYEKLLFELSLKKEKALKQDFSLFVEFENEEYKSKLEQYYEELKNTETFINKISDLISKTDKLKLVLTGDLTNIDLYENFKSIYEEYKNICKNIDDNQEKINQLKSSNEELEKYKKEKIEVYNLELETYQSKYEKYIEECNNIDKLNSEINIKKEKLNTLNVEIEKIKFSIENMKLQLPEYTKQLERKKSLENDIDKNQDILKSLNDEKLNIKIQIQAAENGKNNYQKEYDDYLIWKKNNIIWKVYSKLIKNNFKDIVFEYYRSYLNNTLNYLLSDVNFKLYWNKNSDLTMISCDNGMVTYQSVHQSSGMETTFLGLALIYTIHVLNVKNSVSHIFIDEISGTLNKGTELSYIAKDYQDLFVKILGKFKDKSIWIVDHSIDDLHENVCYEVIPKDNYSIFIIKD